MHCIRSEKMTSWRNIRYYVYWNRCEIILYDLMSSAMLIGKDVTGSFHDQFELLCGLVQMIEDDVMTQLRRYIYRNRWYSMVSWLIIKFNVDWKEWDRKLSLQIWSNNWISTDDRGWRHDIICGDILIGTDVEGCCLEKFKSAMWIGQYVMKDFTTNLINYLE
jgi:hypothetical protein